MQQDQPMGDFLASREAERPASPPFRRRVLVQMGNIFIGNGTYIALCAAIYFMYKHGKAVMGDDAEYAEPLALLSYVLFGKGVIDWQLIKRVTKLQQVRAPRTLSQAATEALSTTLVVLTHEILIRMGYFMQHPPMIVPAMALVVAGVDKSEGLKEVHDAIARCLGGTPFRVAPTPAGEELSLIPRGSAQLLSFPNKDYYCSRLGKNMLGFVLIAGPLLTIVFFIIRDMPKVSEKTHESAELISGVTLPLVLTVLAAPPLVAAVMKAVPSIANTVSHAGSWCRKSERPVALAAAQDDEEAGPLADDEEAKPRSSRCRSFCSIQ